MWNIVRAGMADLNAEWHRLRAEQRMTFEVEPKYSRILEQYSPSSLGRKPGSPCSFGRKPRTSCGKLLEALPKMLKVLL
jgi:hypothetical protein